MRFINSKPELHGIYTFVLNENLKCRLACLNESDAYDIKYIQVKKKYRNSIERGISEWKEVTKVIEAEANYTEIIFLDIDPFLHLVATRQFKRFNLAVKGILFAPYYHFKEANSGPWFYIRHIIRSYFFQKYSTILNPRIKKLFILNDEKCIENMNSTIKNIFSFLPDPINDEVKVVDSVNEEAIKTKYNIRPGCKNLLLFGSIDYRKNLINIINSLLLMPLSVRKNINLIIAGKFHPDIKEKYLQHIQKHKNNVSLCYYDEFISDEEREVLFKHSDVVLMPYTNFFGSSGILGHTIKHNKRVVASNTGLVSRLVIENQLGLTVDPYNKHDIRDAILQILKTEKSYQYNGAKILKKYNPIYFSQTLLLE
ncbi:glycosyltransferase [Pontibacter ruber]|uniref:Glycosyltransferase n=1 Tax=Pontibacter ruber TaxID=1343895 RepID=A0ABW5CT70_9BACT|nr:glycosyltransferase [Pontibacter ruber]